MAFISPPIADTKNAATPVANVLAYENQLSASSYASLDSGAVYVYDKYNDGFRYIGAAGLCAGLCANTDQVADAWFSPAGVNRGQLLGVAKLAHNPKTAERDELYVGKVNPIATFPGRGVVVFGQKTLQQRQTALDRVNVRRLLISLKSFISQISDNLVFEQNTVATRNNFLTQVNPFLESVQQRQGLFAFKVTMDDTNNGPDVIDRNELRGAIFIQPVKAAEFIVLDFNVLPTGAEFPG